MGSWDYQVEYQEEQNPPPPLYQRKEMTWVSTVWPQWIIFFIQSMLIIPTETIAHTSTEV